MKSNNFSRRKKIQKNKSKMKKRDYNKQEENRNRKKSNWERSDNKNKCLKIVGIKIRGGKENKNKINEKEKEISRIIGGWEMNKIEELSNSKEIEEIDKINKKGGDNSSNVIENFYKNNKLERKNKNKKSKEEKI